ncbi:GNAT family N-acetyltransferase [Halorussus halobius]|uniref:GNAT family N-acetyltransferase n=1 Tax=Halorussus halobius TaxID=1710537 RepID=UPI0010926E40|nr:GNAT family protein [Halorussus halobius]
MPGVAFERGERVALYTVERDDATVFQRGRNHPDLRGPLGLADPTNAAQVVDTVEDWVERDDSANLLVCLPPDESNPEAATAMGAGGGPTPVGAVNAWDLDRPHGQLSYWLFPAYQGEGYATEATTLFLDYLFDAREIRGVEARVFSHNDASAALLDRLGFTREGRLRERNFVDGAYRDELVFGLLREEWVGNE